MSVLERNILELLDDAHGRTGRLHGERHWRQVAQVGWYLADRNPLIDHQVLFAFALLHDSRRLNDGSDPGHGPRAADRFLELWHGDGPMSTFNDTQFWLLWSALEYHTGANPSSHPTVGACYDADRLTLWRCHIEPDPYRLSLEFAQRPEVIDWAHGLVWGAIPTLDWEQLVDAYRLLDDTRQLRLAPELESTQ